MRLISIATAGILLAGCSQVPSEVKIHLASSRVLAVTDFRTQPATEYSGCSVAASIAYDVVVEPSNFTGIVSTRDASIKIAGWEKKANLSIVFIKGKPEGPTIVLYESASEDDPKIMQQAICQVKSSSDIVLASLGKPLMAIPGIIASTNEER